MADALTLTGISRRFGPVQALDAVDFSLHPGEIHALLGENGAGKSTLMRIAAGLARPDAGTITIRGTELGRHSPALARRLGLGMVHQHFTSIAELTVAENVALAAGWRFRPREIAERVTRLGDELGLPLTPAARVADLSAGLRQRLEVVKALAAGATILLLDEPSSVLPPNEVDRFLERLAELRRRGVASVLITHKLHEATAVADRVTVLRRGRVVYSGSRGEASATALARQMLGADPPPRPVRAAAELGEVRLVVEGALLPRLGESGTGLESASLTVRAGEVVGVAAIEGNGQRELLRLAGRLARPARGRVQVTGRVSFIPEDRSGEGSVGALSLTEHLVLAAGADAPWVRRGMVHWKEAADRASQLMLAYGVKAASPEARVDTLSGGNQQRLIIAAALAREPALLVAENPTRGLDLAASAEVLSKLRDAASHGLAVLVYLPDLDELFDVSDRVVVLAGGRLIDLPSGAGREEVATRMLGAST